MILHAMLQRLYASLVHGPSMNARPHRSRQRCDLMDLACFKGTEPSTAMRTLLEKGKLEFPAKVPVFTTPESTSSAESSLTPEQQTAREAWSAQSRLLKKLRDITADATDYINDHGESCLALGFPLLSMPAGTDETGARMSGRILAPLLLMPLEVQVRSSSRAGVTLECAGEGADMLVANPALIAWLERQTGKQTGDLFLDDEAADPWREVSELLKQISTLLDPETPVTFTAESILAAVPTTENLPKEVTVLPSAVLGLFPLSNQSLLRDTRWMMENEKSLVEPVSAFLSPQALQNDNDPPSMELIVIQQRNFPAEWLVSNADPCQANAVLAAREARALVVHGPPGTGKSQTITNMIADHLARRQRVLFVCDKRTALDVVKYRLDATGLGDLCGVVHDPGGDRKDFYMGLRAQLETLADSPVPEDPRHDLEAANKQLAAVHSELESARKKLHLSPDGKSQSFHELLGVWLALASRADLPAVTPDPAVTSEALESAHTTLNEIARRAASAGYASNPLRGLHTMNLSDVLIRSPSDIRATFSALHDAAKTADASRPADAVLDGGTPFEGQASQRRTAAQLLRKLAAATDREMVQKALRLSEKSRKSLAAELAALRPLLESLSRSTLDRTLLASARAAGVLTLAAVNQHLTALGEWQAVTGSFFKRLFSGAKKRDAVTALQPLGLSLPSGTAQAKSFYEAVKSRLLLADLLARITGDPAISLPEDADIESKLETAHDAWAALAATATVARASLPEASLEKCPGRTPGPQFTLPPRSKPKPTGPHLLQSCSR